MTNKKARVKYDRWFLMVLAIMLWTLTSHLVGLLSLLPYNLANLNLWARTLASGLGIYGTIWVLRMYLTHVRQTARRIDELDEMLKDEPELKRKIIEVLEK